MILRHLRHAVLWALVLTAAAQQTQGAVQPQDNLKSQLQPQAAAGLTADARGVRTQLTGIFQQYPPSLREVLQLDPALLNNSSYLSLYPGLAAFVAQHPEIAHNPAFFIGLADNYGGHYDESWGRSIERIIEPLAVASVVIFTICFFGWIFRSIVNHRRWLRASKLQTEMQHKLLERFTSNEEMLAFIQTSAGQRFLESASMPAEQGPRALSAPVGRMLWSIQLGVVILAAGAGLEIVSYKLSDYADAVTGFQVAGGIVIALGIGFILSALGSYVLSRRLGLMDPAPVPSLK